MAPSLSVILALLVCCLAPRAAAQSCSVPTTCTGGAGTLTTVYSDAGACTLTTSSAALQALINTQPASIVLCPSTVAVTGTLTITASLAISCFTVTSPPSCILDGQNAVQVMSVIGGGVTVQLTGLELTVRQKNPLPSSRSHPHARRTVTATRAVDCPSRTGQPSMRSIQSSITTMPCLCARQPLCFWQV